MPIIYISRSSTCYLYLLTPPKPGRYQVSWYDGAGVQHRQVVRSKAAATELFERVCAQKLFEKSGLQPALGQKAQNMRRMTVRELGERYVREHLSRTRAPNNRCYVDRIVGKWGEWRLAMVVPEQVRPWIHELLDEGRLTVSSVRKVSAYFKRMFAWGCEAGLIGENPLRYLVNETLRRQLRRVNKRTRTINQEEFWKLQDALPQWMRRVTLCAWCTGMREGEILDLQWSQVDLVQRLIRLESVETKEGDHKTVGIEQALLEEMIAIQCEQSGAEAGGIVFRAQKGGRISRPLLSRRFRRFADEAGFEGLRIHDLRHCYVNRKRRDGHDKAVIKAQTGHHSDSMYDWYSKVDEHEIQAMAGYCDQGLEVIEPMAEALVKGAREAGIPLEAVQSLVANRWRVKA